jgi:dTDP-4-dehydrorhamnose 3,5-epimerase-like enzyme
MNVRASDGQMVQPSHPQVDEGRSTVHVPVGVAHGIKAEGGELTLVDFAQSSFDPNKMEWIK